MSCKVLIFGLVQFFLVSPYRNGNVYFAHCILEIYNSPGFLRALTARRVPRVSVKALELSSLETIKASGTFEVQPNSQCIMR